MPIISMLPLPVRMKSAKKRGRVVGTRWSPPGGHPSQSTILIIACFATAGGEETS